ncbi:MAG: DNA repair exonuclease [Chloroflexi bacterium]|nr:DNA repair exonuclease [Chloroflexota bacterium]
MSDDPYSNNVSERKRIRLLHTSDLHVGTDIYPEEAIQGFEAMLGQCRSTSPDAVLIAGDLFDHHRVPDRTIDRVLTDLADLGLPVVILPGNHDTVLKDNIDASDLPANISLITMPEGESVTLDQLGLTVWGRPVFDHLPSFRPLEGMPPKPSDGWFVAMAHGLFMEVVDPIRSSPITPDDVAGATCDYLALGHVHVFRDVSRNGVPAYYSGAPSGSQARTVAIVDLDPASGVSVTPLKIP